MALASGEVIEVRIIGNATSAVAATNEQIAAQERLAASAKTASSAATKMGKSFYTQGTKMATMGQAMTRYISLPLAAIGVASIAAASSFQKNMVLLRTETGASAKEVKRLHKYVLELAQVSKFGPTDMSKALYQIESGGIRGVKAMKALKQATHLASIGNAELEVTAKAMVSAYNAGVKGAHNFSAAAGTMNAIIGTGNLRMSELVASMTTGVLTTARQAGISLTELGAAMATLTSQGIPAQVAGTRLRMALHLLVAPSEKAKGALEEIGIKGDTMARMMSKPHGLVKAIELLKTHLDDLHNKYKAKDILSAAFGGARTGTTVEALVFGVNKISNKINQIHENAKNVNKDFKETTKTLAFQLSNVWARIQVAAVKIGEAIGPVLIPMLKSVVKFVINLADWFTKLSTGTQKWIVKLGLVAIVMGPLIIFFGRLIQSIGVLLESYGKFTDLVAGSSAAETEAATSAGILAGAQDDLAASTEAATAAQEAQIATFANTKAAMTSEAAFMGTAGTTAATAGGGIGARGMAGGVLGRLPKAAMYGAGLAIGGQIIGSQVGGKAGGVISSIGTGAGIGAALGTVVPVVGTGVGAGIGAAAGGLMALLKTGNKVPAMEQRIKDSIKAVTVGFQQSRQAVVDYKEVQGQLVETQHKGKHITNELGEAEHHLKHVREDDKASTQELHAAELDVYNLRLKQVRNANEQNSLEERSHEQRKTTVALLVNEANRLGIAFREEEKRRKGLLRREVKEGKSPELTQKLNNTLERLNNLEDKRNTTLSDLGKISKHVRTETEGLTRAQQEFGREGGSITRVLKAQKEALADVAREGGKGSAEYQILAQEVHKLEHRMQTFLDRTSPKLAAFAATGSTHIKGLKTAFENMGEGTREALEALGVNVRSAAQTLGVKAPQFHFVGGNLGKTKGFEQTREEQKKQRGGHIAIGAPSGDSVPAMLEKDEYVLNRKAVRHLGRHFLDTVNFGAAPRFQKGGPANSSLHEPKLSGPGALQTIGQAAIHEAFKFAQDWMKRIKPSFAAFGTGNSATERQLEKLWVEAKGPKGVAHTAAAIAMAESGGNPAAHNPSGASGLWQILGTVVPGNIFNPFINALNAVKKYREAGGFSPWVTFTSGAYQAYMQKGGSVPGYAEGGYVNPFKHIGYPEGRIDQGWDTHGKTGVISAAGKGVSLGAGAGSGWPGGGGLVYKLLDGPKAGKMIYHFEGVKALVSQGQNFDAGESIANIIASSYPWSESGWAGSGLNALAGEQGHYGVDGTETAEGKDFVRWVKSLPNKGGGGQASAAEKSTPSAPSYIKGKMPVGARTPESIAGGVGPKAAYAGHYKVQTSPLSFGSSFPKTIEGCKKELRERRRDLAEYRAAIHDNPKYKSALEKNLNLVRARISALLNEIKRLLAVKRREKILTHIKGRGAFPDLEVGLEGLEQQYEAQSENAEQIVALEPAEETAALFNYIAQQEIPAYQGILETENRWRNAVIGGEEQVMDRQYGLRFQIAHIERLKKNNPEAYKKEKYKLPGLKAALEETENLYSKKVVGNKNKTTVEGGSLADKLVELQGRSTDREIHDRLPWYPEVGFFGTGVIWNTQMQIKELALKEPAKDDTTGERLALQEALTAELRRELALHGQTDVIKQFLESRLPFIGAFAKGGTVPLPMGQAGMALVHGQETIIPAGASGNPVTIYLSGDLRSAVKAHAAGLVKQADETIGRDSRRLSFAPGRP